jgi:hypothetical protein
MTALGMIAEQHKRPATKRTQEQAEHGIRAKLSSEVRDTLGRSPQVVQNSDSQRDMPIHGMHRTQENQEDGMPNSSSGTHC